MLILNSNSLGENSSPLKTLLSKVFLRRRRWFPEQSRRYRINEHDAAYHGDQGANAVQIHADLGADFLKPLRGAGGLARCPEVAGQKQAGDGHQLPRPE